MAPLDDVTTDKMRRVLRVLLGMARPVAVYLFGSRVDGRADTWSDYDLAVFIENAEEWDSQGLARFCAAVQKEAGDDIELHVFPATQAQSPEPASCAAYIIAHGVRLSLDELAA